MGIARKDEDKIEDLTSALQSEESQSIMPTYMEMRAEANIYERMDVDSYGDLLFISVDREFRGQGLATEMYERALKLLKSKGLKCAESVFSSPISQRIAKRLGFTELSRRYFKEYKTLDGSQSFPQAKDDEVSILMAISI